MKDYDNFPELTQYRMQALIRDAEAMLAENNRTAGSIYPSRREMSDVEKQLALREAQRNLVTRRR